MEKLKTVILLFVFLLLSTNIYADEQLGTISGTIVDQSSGERLIGANLSLQGTRLGAATDSAGEFSINDVPKGNYILQVQYVGYQTTERLVRLNAAGAISEQIGLAPKSLSANAVVVTATRTEQKRKEAPVIVNVLDEFVFDNTQSLSLAEGLNFQPGVRLEVDCQTCNYTQIRMNGLGGAYSQILIDSRPVFSPLNGLYGLDYIPTNMIERVETIRGGGSALFGSSAIGGVVNILTKEPEDNQFSLSLNNASIDGKAPDRAMTMNGAMLNETRDSGIHLFGMLRDRDVYDNNNDGFSEISRMSVNAFGMRAFHKPSTFGKLTLEAHSINEERQGGNRNDRPPHEADQSEFRDHKVFGAGLSYEHYFSEDLNKFNLYVSGQTTERFHYTGLDQDLDAYGTTDNNTLVGGWQYTHLLSRFIGKTTNTITVGMEGVYDDVDDHIPGFNVRTDQITRQLGGYLQSDWQLHKRFSTLLGVRFDHHNFVDDLVVNPRATLLYSLNDEIQWRSSIATGFRAPQAFDADLHIAFAGGGISRIRLSENLEKERSVSYSTSLDYNHSHKSYFLGFTLEGFYTRLFDAFVLEEAEVDGEGNLILERRNGGNSTVMGASGELRLNLKERLQLGASITIQSSEYDRAIQWSAEAPASQNYLRTPSVYGSYTADLILAKPLSLSISGVYTGAMDVPHLAGFIEEDILVRSSSFLETNVKMKYQLPVKEATGLTFFAGVQNLFNDYQNDFDLRKDRDSNYVYGPARPRTVFSGVEISL